MTFSSTFVGLATILSVLTSGSCDSPAAAGGEPLEVQFEAHRVFQRLYPTPLLTVVGSQATVDGEFELGYPCFFFEGKARLLDQVISLDVVVKPNSSDNCPTLISLFRYRATITALSPGTYKLTVWHVNGTIRYTPATWSFVLP